MSAPATSPRDPKPPSRPEIQVLTPTLAASGTTIVSASSTEERRSTDSSVTVIWPDSTRDRSSTSLTSASRCAPAFSMCWMRASCCSDGGSAVSSRSSWEKPRTAFSGVRSSWLMRDRNSVFARLDASSASRACRSARAVCRPVTSRRTAVSERPALGLVAGERDLERELLAVGAPAEQLAHLAAVDVADLQLLRSGRLPECADAAG